MSIEDYKFSYFRVIQARVELPGFDDTLELELRKGTSYIYLDKDDSQAIARHFNQDLITKLKELIRDGSDWAADLGEVVVLADDLQKLIEDKLDNEDI